MVAEEDCANKSVAKKIHHNPAGNICVQLLLIDNTNNHGGKIRTDVDENIKGCGNEYKRWQFQKAMQILMMEMMITWKSMVSVELSRLVLHSILSRASACASSPSASATAGLSCLDNENEDIDGQGNDDEKNDHGDSHDKESDGKPGCEYGGQPGQNRRACKEQTRRYLNMHKLSGSGFSVTWTCMKNMPKMVRAVAWTTYTKHSLGSTL